MQLIGIPKRTKIVLKILYGQSNGRQNIIFLNGQTTASFSNKHHYNFYNKYMWKMTIQYTVPGFEPPTFVTWVSTHNH